MRSGCSESTGALRSSVMPQGLKSRGVVAPLKGARTPHRYCQRNTPGAGYSS